jgi:hypothetical protein
MIEIVEAIVGRRVAEFSGVFGTTPLVPPPPTLPGEPRYLEFPERGISIVLGDNDVADTLQLWPDGVEPAYHQYQGSLPAALTFASSREEARNKLGAPIKSSEGGQGKGMFGGFMYPWDRFHCDGWRVHFEYRAGAIGIRLVSISLLKDDL